GERRHSPPAQLGIEGLLSQPGISMALVGGHKPHQIRETAQARPLSSALCEAIDQLIVDSGGTS
ncbi:MAG TPA: aldo/keto reductase, partial [Rhodopirellula sp.]|nr:aldo/keto reductase [Rhodopirellula sp.]